MKDKYPIKRFRVDFSVFLNLRTAAAAKEYDYVDMFLTKAFYDKYLEENNNRNKN